jgi:NhaA family Na+:H+ antiporter
VYRLTPYLLLGAVLWLCFYNSGVHATLAGVVLAFTLPVKSNVNLRGYTSWLGSKSREFGAHYDSDQRVLGQHDVTATAREVGEISRRVTPPLQRVEHGFTFWVNFIILPVFAFVNAQVYIADANMAQVLTSPVTLGVWVGLVVGKPVGILFTTWVLVRFLGFSLPKNTRWGHMVGIGMLGGIGFTMAILVDGLAFTDPSHIMEGKVGILLGTFTAAILGLTYMAVYLKISEKRHGVNPEVLEGEQAVDLAVDLPEGGTVQTSVGSDANGLIEQAVTAAVEEAVAKAAADGSKLVRVAVTVESENGTSHVVDLKDPSGDR